MRIPALPAVACTALLLLCVPAWAQPQNPPRPDPLVRVEGLRKVSDHVSVIPDSNSVPLVPNVGYVVGEKAVLVIDTGLGPRNGAAVYEVAKKLAGSRSLYLVATHYHPEHDLGAQAFPASTLMIRSSDEDKDIAEFGYSNARFFATWSAINAELLQGAQYRRTDIGFGSDMRLDLGGVQVHLFAMGANHTRGDVAIWVENDRVLFAGDIAMRAQPAFASPYSSLDHWLDSLDRLGSLRPVLIVPSHGPSGGAELIDGYRAYLLEVRERVVAEKRAGHTVEAAVDNVAGAMAQRFPDRMRLDGAVKAAYREGPQATQ